METKICGNCNKIKAVTGFYKQKGGKFGVRSICKVCCIEQSKSCKTFNYQSARSRAIKLGAIAIWADVKKIKEFYEKAKLYTEKCSMNYNVDHIDPLQHWLVCGLHVETNLQILTESENSSKRNDFIPYRIDQDGKIHRLKIDPLWNKKCKNYYETMKTPC